MRGEFIGAWSETWGEVWQPLTDPTHARSMRALRAELQASSR